MTKFVRDQFQYSGGYLTYGPNRLFVARFKYCARDKAAFLSFLIKNFTVEEYFANYADGTAPSAILKAKGYVSTTVKRILKDAGYPQTVEGAAQHIQDGIAKRAAEAANPTPPVVRTIIYV